jgi:hypothetical protein
MAEPEQPPIPRVRRSRWKRIIKHPPTIVALIVLFITVFSGMWLYNVIGEWFGKDTPKTESVKRDEKKPRSSKILYSDSAVVREKIQVVLAGMKQSDVAVYGRIKHVSGGIQESVEGASVSLIRSGDYRKEEVGGFVVPSDGPSFLSFKTDRNGLYFFRDNLVPGEYQLVASPPRNSNLAPVTQTLVIESGNKLRKDILLPKGWVLTGRVLRADKKTPVIGARVTVRSLRSDLQWVGQAKTDEKGNYKLKIGAALPCTLRAKDKAGNSFIIRRIDRDSALVSGKTIRAATVILETDVRKGYSLFCQMQSERGAGLGKVTCELRHKTSGKLAGKATSGIAGGLEIEGLKPGSYLLYVTSPKTWQTKDGKPIAVDLHSTQKTRTKVVIVTLVESAK